MIKITITFLCAANAFRIKEITLLSDMISMFSSMNEEQHNLSRVYSQGNPLKVCLIVYWNLLKLRHHYWKKTAMSIGSRPGVKLPKNWS